MRAESWISGLGSTEKWDPRRTGPGLLAYARSSGESGPPSGCTLANGEVMWATGALLSSSVGFLGSVMGDNLTLVSKTMVEGSATCGPQSYH